MTKLEAMLDAAGLGGLLEARRQGAVQGDQRERLDTADLLLLGALADHLRKQEVGDRVEITIGDHASAAAVTPPDMAPSQRGLAFLRAVAIARIASAPGARILVDWSSCGQELAQVALSFGANALRGPVVSRRGLPIADDKTKKVKGEGLVPVAKLKEKELVELIRRSGREPVLEGVTA